jgi:hypothetical protein
MSNEERPEPVFIRPSKLVVCTSSPVPGFRVGTCAGGATEARPADAGPRLKAGCRGGPHPPAPSPSRRWRGGVPTAVLQPFPVSTPRLTSAPWLTVSGIGRPFAAMRKTQDENGKRKGAAPVRADSRSFCRLHLIRRFRSQGNGGLPEQLQVASWQGCRLGRHSGLRQLAHL